MVGFGALKLVTIASKMRHMRIPSSSHPNWLYSVLGTRAIWVCFTLVNLPLLLECPKNLASCDSTHRFQWQRTYTLRWPVFTLHLFNPRDGKEVTQQFLLLPVQPLITNRESLYTIVSNPGADIGVKSTIGLEAIIIPDVDSALLRASLSSVPSTCPIYRHCDFNP